MRTALALIGVAASVGLLACLLAFGRGYQAGLGRELNGMGIQMMLVPLGCPFDAAARVIKGKVLDTSLPENAVQTARQDPSVACAAPVLMAAVPHPSEGRTDMWEGIDPSMFPLKPWWKLKSGTWFSGGDSVVLGADAAATEMRQVGDMLYSPETHRTLKVAGILEHSGTSDDSLFFVPLATAQSMFHQPGRLTAVAIRLKDPAEGAAVAERLQKIPGAQTVTLAEMLNTFLDLVGSVRTLVLAITILAVAISALSVFNTMLASVLERTNELGVLRAVGASRGQVFALLAGEAALLTGIGTAIGLLLALGAGHSVEMVVKQFLPFAPRESMLTLTGAVIAQCSAIGLAIGILAGLYPAIQASRLQPALALKVD